MNLRKIKNTDLFETLKHSKNYLSANVANKAIIFISIPIFTRLFSEADYGIVATFTAFVGIMTVVLSLNASSAINRYYYEMDSSLSPNVYRAFRQISRKYSALFSHVWWFKRWV